MLAVLGYSESRRDRTNHQLKDFEYEIDFADFDWDHPKLYYNSDGVVVRASFRLVERKVKMVVKDFVLQ